MKKFDSIEALVGHTPLIKLLLKYRGEEMSVYAKAESYNFSGSIKDRVAFSILKNAYESGKIDKSYTIAEATSGNTGIAFSAIGGYLGNKVRIYMPDKMSVERKKLVRGYGAEIIEVSEAQGGFLGSIDMCEKYAKENEKVFLPRQFSNEENVMAHYNLTAKEFVEQMDRIGENIDGFVSGIGTGGTLMGFARRLKEVNPKARIFPMEPASSTTLSNGTKGHHRIEGISDEFVPPIVDRSTIDSEIITVDDGDAIIMAQMLSKELGLGVGISSGANVIASIKAKKLLGDSRANIVTVFADDNKKYLSTDLTASIEKKSEFLTNDIELIDFIAYRY